MSEPKRAAIYCRVSTTGQEDNGTSLQTQEAACRKYAVDRGYAVANVYSEAHTGSELYERKALGRLRDSVRDGHLDVLIAYTVDRLSRNQAHVYILAHEMEQAGVAFEFVTETFEDSAVGKFIRSAKAFAAELELEGIKERTMRGKVAKARSGKPLGQGAMRYGYQWRDESKTAYAVDPQAGPVIAEVFARAVRGESMREIARALSQRQVPTPSGQLIPWVHSAVKEILIFPGYAGTGLNWRWKTHKKKNGKRRRELRPMDEWLPLAEGTMPAIVDLQTWEAAQRILEANRDRAGRKPTYPESHLLRGGFVFCGTCGKPMSAGWNAKDHKPKYECRHSRESLDRCQAAPSIHAHIIDMAVWQIVERILLQPDLVSAELAKVRSTDPVQHDLDSLDRTLFATAKKQSRLLDALSEADDDLADAIKSKLSVLSETKRQIQQERERLLAYRANWQTHQADLDSVETWCKQLAGRLDRLDFASRQLALRALGVKVRVWRVGHDPRYEITTSLPVQSMELADTSPRSPPGAGRG